MLIVPIPVTVIDASPFCSTGKPAGPISVHVSVAFDRSKGSPVASSSVPAMAQSVAAINSVSSWWTRAIASPGPGIAGAQRAATPALIALAAGALVVDQPD